MKNESETTPIFQLEPAYISMFQFSILYFTFIISTIDIFVPYLIVQRAGRDGWISVIAALFVMLPVAANAIALTLRFPRRSFIEYSQLILGPLPGRIVGFFYLFAILVLGATTARELGEIMKIAFFEKTPQIVFPFLTVFLTTYIVWNGFEVINRVNGIFLPIGLFFLVFVFSAVVPRADLTRYLPIMENGFKQAVSGSLILVAQMSEGLFLFSILPLLTQPRKVIKAALITIPLLNGSLLLGTISIAVFGLEPTMRLLIPALELSRVIEIPGLPRLDMFIMAGWYTGIFVKLSLIHYLLVLLTAQWAGLESYKPIIIPYGVIIVTLSILMFGSATELVQFIGSPFTYFLLTFEFAVPLILLVISLLRGVEEKKTA